MLSDNYKYIAKSDIIVIAVPTPLTANLSPDLSYIKKAIISMKKYIKKGQLISIESTTYPGTTQDLLGEFIKKEEFIISRDYFLVYSPERISPELQIKDKKIKYKLDNTPKVCGGYSKNCKIT